MITTPNQTLSVPATRCAGLWKVWFPILGFALLWVDMIRQLSYQWESNEQYAYGWFVPFLALALFWKRWTTRPSVPQPSALNPQPSRLLTIFVFFVAFCLLPLRVVHEINQDWPLISWPLTVTVVALSLYAVFLQGGGRWVAHFAFPICFILVAVRWPYRIEHGLTQSLMQIVASLTVEILGWFDLPAFQRGNLIELSTGMVGVDEACSGIRSFQSTIMGALFLGELYLLSWPRRALLLFGGVALAFCFNVVRTLILTWQASTAGLSALDKWHDPAGMAIFLACFACLWAAAAWLRRRDPQPSTLNPQPPGAPQPQPVVRPPSSDAAAAVPTSALCPLPSDIRSPSTPSSFVIRHSSLRRYLIAVGCWAILCFVATETWYRSHHILRADTAKWWASYPTNLPSFQPVTVPEASAKLLRHDVESGGSWDEPDGTKWTVFCFRWKEGDPTARMSAQGHRPEYCLVGSGHNLIAMSDTRYLNANGVNLPFRFYTFDSGGRPMHVFFCLWEDGAEKQTGFGQTKSGDRLRTAWSGRRGMGQQTLEIICTGYPDMAAAEKAVRQRLPELIRVENQKAGTITAGL